MTIGQLDGVLLLAAGVLLVAIAAVRLTSFSGFPSLLLYLGIGLLIGEGGLGIRFDDAELTGVLGYCALVLILAEGGLTTRWRTIRSAVAPAAVLSTLGVVVSMGLAGAAAHLILGLSWTMALVLGAAVTSTDAAAVFSVLRALPLPRRAVGLLEAESGFNDAPVVIVVVALTAQAAGEVNEGVIQLVVAAALELTIGAVIGLAVGALGATGLRRVALPSSGLYPLAVFGLAVGAYGAAATAHGSGFLAVYLATLVLGNVRLPHGSAVRGFAEGLGWMAQIGLFVLLGLLASPSRLPAQVLPAVLLGLVLLLVARPVSVLVSVSWFRIPLREQIFLSWAGLRGAVPVVLATIPVASGLPGSRRLFDIVFVLVVVFTVLQAPTLPWVARRLGLVDGMITVDLDVESSPLGALSADVIHVRVGATSKLHGVEVFELRLPRGANVTLVIRGDESFVPGPGTALRHGDDLILVTTAGARERTERRLREVSRAGKLAGWKRGTRASRPDAVG